MGSQPAHAAPAGERLRATHSGRPSGQRAGTTRTGRWARAAGQRELAAGGRAGKQLARVQHVDGGVERLPSRMAAPTTRSDAGERSTAATILRGRSSRPRLAGMLAAQPMGGEELQLLV